MDAVTYDTKTLQRLSMFVLNRATSDLRSELHEWLVMVAISDDKEKKGTTKTKIISVIENDLKVSKFPDTSIKSAIERLKEKRYIEAIHGKGEDVYFLSQDKINAIEIMGNLYFKTVVRIKETLAKKISNIKGSPIDLGVENIVFASFQKLLGIVLSRLGEQCCYAIISSQAKELDSLKSVDMISILNEVSSETKDDELREAERQAFLEYLSEPDDDLRDYLFSLAQSYFIINVLHLDPECSLCTKQSLQQKKVFIDTNVIVHALLGSKNRNKAADSALKLTSELGIGIVFSKRTKQEFDNYIQDAKRDLGREPRVPKGRFEKIRNDLEDGMLKGYLLKKQKQPTLTLAGYAGRFEEIEAILRNRYSAVYDSNDYEDVANNLDLSKLKEIVTEEGIRFALYKSDVVAEHDAFHILLIQELRKNDKGDFLGPKYWFLTHDRSLYFVEKRFEKFEAFPSSIFLDNWVQLISPMLAPEQTKTAKDTYSDLFASRLPMLSKTIDEETFLAFQGDWVDDEDLTPQDIARVIGNKYVRNLHEKLEQEKKQLTDEERDLIIRPLVEELKTQKKEVQELNSKITSVDQKVSTLKGEVSTLRNTVVLQNNLLTWFGHLMGAIIFVVFWYVLYQYVLVQSLTPWPAFVGAIIIAAIFGYLADFHGYKWLVEKLVGHSLRQGQSSAS